jgi:hypothetical protein
MNERRLADGVIKEIFAYESINGALSNKTSKRKNGEDSSNAFLNMTGVKRWGAEDLQSICSVIRQRQQHMPDTVLFSPEQRRAAEFVLAQEAINKAVDAALTSKSVWDKLPKAMQDVAGYAKAAYDKEAAVLNGAENSQLESRYATECKAEWAKNTVKDILFTGMASVVNGAAEGYVNLTTGTYIQGIESLQAGSAYALHYPVLEFYAQWVNAAGCIWSKLVKTVNMLSPESSMPIEHKSQVYVFRDKDNKKIAEVKREDYFRYMDMNLLKEKNLLSANIDIYNQLLKHLTIQQADFNKRLSLYEPVTGSTEAVLKPLQQAIFSFEISELLLQGETSGGATNKFKGNIYDYDGTPIQGTPLTEFHYNGRALFLTPDTTKPTEQYVLTIHFDAKLNEIFVSYTKTATTLADIDSIKFDVKVLDLPRLETANSQIETRTYKTNITAGPVILREINFNPEYNSFLEAKTGSGKIVEDEINARTEELSNLAESIFTDGYKKMCATIKEQRKKEDADAQYQSYVFWAHAEMDLQEANALMKGENYNMRMSRVFQELSTSYSNSANTNAVGMNIWCHVESLNPLNPAMMPVIGTVNSDTAGDFLGVVSPVEAYVFTAGTNNGPSPVKAVIVGTKKADDRPDRNKAYADALAAIGGGALKPSQDQISAHTVFNYNISPQFAEPNLETHFMTRVALSMTDSSMGYRSASVPNVPHIQMKSGFKHQVIKGAGGHLAIKGYMAPTVNNWK